MIAKKTNCTENQGKDDKFGNTWSVSSNQLETKAGQQKYKLYDRE